MHLSVPGLRAVFSRLPPNGKAAEYCGIVHSSGAKKEVFGTLLRQARRGLSAGRFGSIYEYFKVCLEDERTFDAKHGVAGLLARAQVPDVVARAMAVSSLTALYEIQ